jgi:hypothetical protein
MMESRYVLNLRRKLVHLAVWDGDQLLSDERCLLARMKHREVIAADPDAERLAGLIGRGYRPCVRCWPAPDPLTDPETALMDAAAHESEP